MTLAVRIGSYSVNFKGNDLGETVEGSRVSFVPSFIEIVGEGTGDDLQEIPLVGMRVSASLILEEFTEARLQVALPYAAIGPPFKLDPEYPVMMRAAHAGILILAPRKVGIGSKTWTFDEAVIANLTEIMNKLKEEKRIPLEFTIFRNATNSFVRFDA